MISRKDLKGVIGNESDSSMNSNIRGGTEKNNDNDSMGSQYSNSKLIIMMTMRNSNHICYMN